MDQQAVGPVLYALVPLAGESFVHRYIDIIGLIGAIVTVIGIIVALIIYQRQKLRKTLDYAITSSHSILLGLRSYGNKRMQVIWSDPPGDGDNVVTARLLTSPTTFILLIKNTGRVAVDETDFKEPISIDLEGEILDASVVGVSHSGICPIGSISDREATTSHLSFKPALLNRGDWIKLELTTNEAKSLPIVKCWIKDESRPMRLRSDLLDPPIRQILRRRLGAERTPLIAAAIGAAGAITSVLVAAFVGIYNR